jgi:hypothetical protein
VSDVGFSYSSRWWQFPQIAPETAITRLEERDRELEQYLDAPAQVYAPRIIATTSPFADQTGLVSNLTARWERQRGQWVCFEAQGTGGPGLSGYAITLPPEAAPLAAPVGRLACIGSAASALTTGLVSPRFVNNQWVIPALLGGAWWSVHVMYLAQQ